MSRSRAATKGLHRSLLYRLAEQYVLALLELI
jgi:hypothetical protein